MPPIETVIKLLSAWKPGQPWPAGIPAPPPGWKPGDPLHLGAPKPKDDGGKGSVRVEPPARVVPAAVTAPPVKPAKPVMPKVPFVKIDLHSDSDEFEKTMVHVTGHTDSTGGYEYNLQLSQKRADSVSSYLAAQGVQSVRLLSRGLGPDRPISSPSLSKTWKV